MPGKLRKPLRFLISASSDVCLALASKRLKIDVAHLHQAAGWARF